MKIRLSYPSGHSFVVVGDWIGPGIIGGELVPAITVTAALRVPGGTFVNRGSVLIGDPRGVYQDADSGAILYNPRMPLIFAFLGSTWHQWLAEHPEWPGVLEIEGLDELVPEPVSTNEEAPGALGNGSRVEKAKSEAGDAHVDGSLGRITGSQHPKDLGYVYCVEWDDMPGLPVWVGETRIRALSGEPHGGNGETKL